MKVKTTVSLSGEVVRLIDRHHREFKSRSAFLELAARQMLSHLALSESDRHDLEILNQRADALNAEAEDVLAYQVA